MFLPSWSNSFNLLKDCQKYVWSTAFAWWLLEFFACRLPRTCDIYVVPFSGWASRVFCRFLRINIGCTAPALRQPSAALGPTESWAVVESWEGKQFICWRQFNAFEPWKRWEMLWLISMHSFDYFAFTPRNWLLQKPAFERPAMAPRSPRYWVNKNMLNCRVWEQVWMNSQRASAQRLIAMIATWVANDHRRRKQLLLPSSSSSLSHHQKNSSSSSSSNIHQTYIW